MKFLSIPIKYRQDFINNLPAAPFKKTLLKSIFVLVVGIILSFILTIALLSFDFIKNFVPEHVTGKFVQDFSIAALVLVFFFRSSISKLKGKLFPKATYKSYLATLFTLLFLFLITLAIFISLTIISQANRSEAQLKEIESFYSQKMDFGYLLQSFSGLLFLLIGAFFEEFIFRFTIFRFLRKKGLVMSLVISSLLFSLVHGNMAIPFSFLAGLIFALHYEYTNNFTRTFIIHALHNYFNVYYASYVTYLFIK